MRPTRHTDPSEDELIAHIRNSLVQHEEAYASGAWERFADKEKKPRGLIFWIGSLSSAAAVFLIAIGLYLYTGGHTTDQPLVQTAKINGGAPEPVKAPQVGSTEPQLEKSTDETKPQSTARTLPQLSKDPMMHVLPIPDVNSSGSVTTTTIGRQLNPAPVVTAKINTPLPEQNKPTVEQAKTTFQEFLNKENLNAKEDKKSLLAANKSEKWEMGVLVAPSFGNTKKLNMGYGVSMGYALSKKVSLSSGISYNELAASKDVTPSQTMSIAGETKNLRSVETNVTGIDVPLEIRYHFNKSLYANVGVSAFAVLNQRQNNSYIQETLVERSAGLASDNKDIISSFIVAQKTTEEAPKSEISEDHYLGFYNFSFGYKQKISKSNSISIEPFMKVPMKEVSKENLRLIGTGVRLKFDF